MLFRFALYGFLKNQRYFEPFLILYFRDQGLTFTQIGVLVAVRELATNLLEIPSGALADLYGRRRAMIGSFAAYIVSFLVLAQGRHLLHFALGMVLFACGDAFRTGTHKAMIFAWLRQADRLSEKTRVYGFTRSWSKLGSALSVIIATAIMVTTGEYRWIFYLSVVPYLAGIVNFLFYPRRLDGDRRAELAVSEVWGRLRESLAQVWSTAHLRRLIAESMALEGTFKVAKDYLQPIARQAALAAPLLLAVRDTARGPLLVGAVYLVFYLVSAAASRNSHLVVRWRGDEERGVRAVWWGALGVYLALVPLLWLGRTDWAIGLFIVLSLLQNLFRPMHISRFDAYADAGQGATILSVESQAKSLAAMVLAPLIGQAVDWAGGAGPGGSFWPLGVVGAVLAAGSLVRGVPRRTDA